MFKVINFCLILIFTSVNGHNGKYVQSLRDDGNLQADLMPQELNPDFAGQKYDPNRREFHFPDVMLMPERPLVSQRVRMRRSAPKDATLVAETPYTTTGIAEQVKQYSRVIACFVLVVSAVIEVVVYIIEAYQVAGA